MQSNQQPTTMPEPVVPVFIPPLVDLLVRAEDEKGTALTREEVLTICGKGVCMMMRQSHADKMAQSRGYADLDPTLCWEQWLAAREQRGAGDEPRRAVKDSAGETRRRTS